MPFGHDIRLKFFTEFEQSFVGKRCYHEIDLYNGSKLLEYDRATEDGPVYLILAPLACIYRATELVSTTRQFLEIFLDNSGDLRNYHWNKLPILECY